MGSQVIWSHSKTHAQLWVHPAQILTLFLNPQRGSFAAKDVWKSESVYMHIKGKFLKIHTYSEEIDLVL